MKKYSNNLKKSASADLEVQLVQLNHCDGVYSNYWNTLLTLFKSQKPKKHEKDKICLYVYMKNKNQIFLTEKKFILQSILKKLW